MFSKETDGKITISRMCPGNSGALSLLVVLVLVLALVVFLVVVLLVVLVVYEHRVLIHLLTVYS